MPLRAISVSCGDDVPVDGDGGEMQSQDATVDKNLSNGTTTKTKESTVDIPAEMSPKECEECKTEDVVKTKVAVTATEDTSMVNSPEPSVAESQSDSYSGFSGDMCRICHSEASAEEPLIEPCICSGSLRFVHLKCLQQWIKSADTKTCELCKFNFVMTSKVKPFKSWQKLDMSSLERRKVLCSVAFHVIAITCVVWSLYVLIDRTTQEVSAGNLEWPFWTKLIVVAIGFTGGLVFMYVQCKMYFQLCRRWRAYNRIIYIQDCPPEAGQEMRVISSTQPPTQQSVIDLDSGLF